MQELVMGLESTFEGTLKSKPEIFHGIFGDVRVVRDTYGEPFFVAKDVCDILGIDDVRQAVERLDNDEKLSGIIYHSGQNRTMWLINESGLYSLIIRSNKPEARAFRKWVTSEVIPSIRKTGKFSINKNTSDGFSLPSTFSEALRLAADQAEQIEKMRPKVESAEALLRCDTNMSITDTAKHFCLHPKLQVFPYLRAKGLLTERSLPSQSAIDNGYMAIRQNKLSNGEFISQAVVEKSSLELWRTKLVPKIIEWSSSQLISYKEISKDEI